MTDPTTAPGDAQDASPDDLLTIDDIMAMYGISRAAVRQWRLTPASEVKYGKNKGKTLRLYRRADVEAYAMSRRRLNRLPKPKS